MNGVQSVFEALLDAYGPQAWWPGRDAFEIIAGAVLVQRTAWPNAAAALDNLTGAGMLSPDRIAGADLGQIESLIMPAGFFRVKARRLRAVAAGVVEAGGIDGLSGFETNELRHYLLGLHGVGPETADAIMLYAFERPAVVVDAYLRRLAARMDGVPSGTGASLDRRLRQSAEAALASVQELNEFHALVVEHAKRVCGVKPRCTSCPLLSRCEYARRAISSDQSGDQPKPSPRR